MDQRGFAYCFEWGEHGLRAVAADVDVLVIVDVLRFTTAVSVAVETGVTVLPFGWDDPEAATHATAHAAVLAGRRERGELSLSPSDLARAERGTRLVLPSPNGSALCALAGHLEAPHVLAGCLRNATATAAASRQLAGATGRIAVIAAGERWGPNDGPVRHAVEDLLGAGAVLAALDPSAARSEPRCSPEAAAARTAFVAARPYLHETIATSGSGRELAARGWLDDVGMACELDATRLAALLGPDGFGAAS